MRRVLRNVVVTDPGNSTVVKSPGWPRGYSNNLRCEWEVSSQPGTRVELRIISLSLESSYRGCLYDKVTVYDGMYGTLNWNKTGDYCNRNHRYTLYSSGTYMKIVFTSDGSVSRGGIYLSLRSVCGGYISSPRGVLTSPGFPAHYPNNTECRWVLRMRPATMLQFQFTDLDIAGGDTECSQDSLVLRKRQFQHQHDDDDDDNDDDFYDDDDDDYDEDDYDNDDDDDDYDNDDDDDDDDDDYDDDDDDNDYDDAGTNSSGMASEGPRLCSC